MTLQTKPNFGLKKEFVDQIIQILREVKGLEKAVIFGSRANNSYKVGSDIDICVFGKQIDESEFNTLKFKLNEENVMPYFFDVIRFDDITTQHLKDEILANGKDLIKL